MGNERTINAGNVDYETWNDALRTAYFGENQAGCLVYLDQDDDAFEKAAEIVGVDRQNTIESLAASIREKLCWKASGRTAFAEFDEMTKRWMHRRRRAEADGVPTPHPPHIALLMILSIAAERMGSQAEDSTSAEMGFYTQLERLLNVPGEESQRIRTSFRKSSEAYWEALRLWLEGEDGEMGLPSAHALMYRYTGLPISQALIRETERRNLRRMFEEQGFLAGTSVSHQEMHNALDVWIRSSWTTANAALIKMWSSPETQIRVTDIALVEFSTWEGPAESGSQSFRSTGGSNRCLLTLREIRQALKTVFRFGMISNIGSEIDERGKLNAAGGVPIEVTLRPKGAGQVGIDFGSTELENGSVLGGDIQIETPSGTQLRRLPKNVVIFTRDPLTESYVESDRITPATSSRVLVHDQGTLVSDVERILDDAAQPGFRRLASGSSGIPSDWVAFDKVQILRTPAAHLIQGTDLSGFHPRLTTQMSLAGGLKLPGRIARWSSKSPLEILIASDSEQELDLYVTSPDPETLQPTDTLVRRGIVPPASIKLAELRTEEKDFTLSLRSGKKTIQTLPVRLRDSSSDRPSAAEPYRYLCHDIADALWAIRAVPETEAEIIGADGLVLQAPPIATAQQRFSQRPTWIANGGSSYGKQRLKLPQPGSDSCIVSGRHLFKLPVFNGQRPKTPWIYGVCSQCGLSRRYPTRIKRNPTAETSAASLSRSELPALTKGMEGWAALADALIHIGTGTRREFSRLVRQIEDSAVFEHRVLNALDALALIEVERDERLNVVHWEVAATCLVGVTNGSWILTGMWTADIRSRAIQLSEKLGGAISVLSEHEESVVAIDGITESQAQEMGELLNVEVVARAALSLAETLPPLSTVVEGLARTGMPTVHTYGFFDVASARWHEAESAEHPGLYRVVKSFDTAYFFRTHEDVAAGSASRVTSELGKHMAALEFGKSLTAYATNAKTLMVPIGADLPGLYGRAAVMGAGVLPSSSKATFSLNYHDVDHSTASILIGKLAS